MSLDVTTIKQDFPILKRQINGKRLVYLDNAATSQKPISVIDSVSNYYKNSNANVHRGAHTLGDESTVLYSNARSTVAKFIGAERPEEIIFTKNSTDSLNMVAWGWGQDYLKKGDKVLALISEHNSSVLPWLSVCEKTSATLEYIYLNAEGQLQIADLKKLLTKEVKVIVMAHASNVLGTIFPVKEICSLAKDLGIKTIIDGAQSAPHISVNVQSLGCDFYAFSGHKMLGPMGTGVLWGKLENLKNMKPFELGGGTVLDVDLHSYELLEIPDRFEAGTPDVAGAVGLASALDYLSNVGMANVRDHEIALNTYALQQLSKINDLYVLGPIEPEARTGLVSFVIKDLHPHDIAAILNSEGVAVRSGMHCAMNLHKSLNINTSTRASYYIYNDTSDIDVLIEAVKKAISILK